jgi:hypothetical protein
MGTRSLTVFVDEHGKNEIAVLYRQYDGYPEGHGLELANFLNGFLIVNGMRGNEPEKFANGMECLAAQIISNFKTEPGNFYLYPADTRDCGEEFIYVVTGKVGGGPAVQTFDYEWSTDWNTKKPRLLFEGSAAEMIAWIAKTKTEEE